MKIADAIYLVSGATVTDPAGGRVEDAAIVRKAAFTARVLDEQVLNSGFNKDFFSVANRLRIFADEASGRLVEPWRTPNLTGASTAAPSVLTVAKQRFKAWAERLAGNPSEAVLAVVRADYRDDIDAYRQNAAIYRKVAQQGEPLGYSDAIAFLENVPATMQLASAGALETALSERATASNAVAGPDQPSVAQFSRRVQSEVVARIDAARSARDLDRVDESIKAIAVAEVPALKVYVDSVKPATIRFESLRPDAAVPSVSPAIAGASSVDSSGRIAIKITTPAPLATNKIVDITGGIMPSPYPLRRPPPAGANGPPSGPNPPAQNQSAGGQRISASNNGNQPGVAGGTPSATGDRVAPADAKLVSAGNQARDGGPAGNFDNLLTYSSKPYHDDAGWVFNPSTGFWQNPNDASETRMPGIITCCDDTGLAFPNDALEAQQNFWNLGGVDPNCGRLYTCDSGVDPQQTADAPPDDPTLADAKQKIRKALDYIKSLPMTDDERKEAIRKFIQDLPDDYILLARQMARPDMRVLRASETGRMIPTPSGPVSRGFSGGAFRPQTNNQSTITGLGGGVSSNYVPATQSIAANMTTKYPVVPTCK